MHIIEAIPTWIWAGIVFVACATLIDWLETLDDEEVDR